jgi:hypothetical protein
MLNYLMLAALVCFVVLVVGGVIAFHVAMMILPVLVYFLPALIAWRRRHPNTGTIVLLNLLLGWTMLGWIALLMWSVVSPSRAQAVSA